MLHGYLHIRASISHRKRKYERKKHTHTLNELRARDETNGKKMNERDESIFTNNAQRSLLLLLMHSFLSKHLKCLCMRSRFLEPCEWEWLVNRSTARRHYCVFTHRRRFFNNWFIWCVYAFFFSFLSQARAEHYEKKLACRIFTSCENIQHLIHMPWYICMPKALRLMAAPEICGRKKTKRRIEPVKEMVDVFIIFKNPWWSSFDCP